MAARPPTREEPIQQDIKDLHRLGYARQLFREMGGFSNFAISFSIISILTGAILLFGYGLKFAGPFVNSVGWPIVSIFTLPPNELVLWTMLALTVGLMLYWQLSAKRTFVGPTRADEQALGKLEEAIGEKHSGLATG